MLALKKLMLTECYNINAYDFTSKGYSEEKVKKIQCDLMIDKNREFQREYEIKVA